MMFLEKHCFWQSIIRLVSGSSTAKLVGEPDYGAPTDGEAAGVEIAWSSMMEFIII